tara:strand:- start:177 stop:338 length:162 start_codon:yes stop_codon:yes gene_type:complete
MKLETKLDYIKRRCEVVVGTEKKELEDTELLSEWVRGRESLAKDLLNIINGDK